MARLKLGLACALTASIAISLAGIAAAVEYVPVSEGLIRFGTDVSPNRVSKPMPISLSVSWRARQATPLGPTRQLVFEVDRHLSFDLGGLPACASALRPSSQSDAAGLPTRCERSLVGKGSILVHLFYPESSPLPLLLKMEIFKSARRDGATTLLAYAPITAPIPGAFIITIEVRKIDRGRFGSELAFSFPRVAQGSGAVVIKSFEATINRRFTFKGNRGAVASLSCPDGKFQIHADALLADGSHAGEEAVVPCSATR